eukprot:GFYU01004548.1.p1 GENE.GFYU01004548.1~~GFYU01004548.1.p1  ORF type:complete len:318 (-),score=65.85 GFYU01004548.1:61-1014(-)
MTKVTIDAPKTKDEEFEDEEFDSAAPARRPPGFHTVISFASTWYDGASDSLGLAKSIVFFYKSKAIRARTAQCFILNGLIFLGSVLLFDYVLDPVIRSLLRNQAEGEELEALADVLGSSFKFVYNILWVYPIYCISFILNSMTYYEIADQAYKIKSGGPNVAPFDYTKMVKRVADEMYRALLFLNYLIMVLMFYIVPYVGGILMFMGFCWLYAYYCFEYKWGFKGWPLEKSIRYFETHWVYFLGFGTPCTLATYFFPTFVNAGLFALMFPMLIITATIAKPTSDKTCALPRRLPIFVIPSAVNWFILRRVLPKLHGA